MRRALLVAIPVLGLALILQTSIVGRIMLLSGNSDILFLTVAAWSLQERARGAWIWGIAAALLSGLVSGIPWYLYLVGYLSLVGMARLLVRRIWQAPLLAMFTVTLIGTLELLMLMYLKRTLFDVTLPFGEVFFQVILPSVLLNLLVAIPVHALVRDLANRVYPQEAPV
jgi:rod shape-determining protein MreD